MTRLPSIANLMSPPEAKPIEIFDPVPSSAEQPFHPQRRTDSDCTLAPIATTQSLPPTPIRILPSPPVSPSPSKAAVIETVEKEQGKEQGKDGSEAPRDPVLYPASHEHAQILPSHQPLFPAETMMATAEEIVARHMSMHLAQFNKKVNRPTRDEYLLALSCVSTLGRDYNRNPGAYMKRTRDETEEQYWKAKRICAQPGTKISPYVNIAPGPVGKAPKRAIKTVAPTRPVARPTRALKSSPQERLIGNGAKGRSATPESRASGTKRPEDVDYRALPDYSPPTSTLPPGNPKSLKADWASNQVFNLSHDPDRAMLHEAELNLAATLRLSCATYLCSKRRIFEARLHALRIGKEFRKTDAQQACKIDVNKASRLWMAYDKVGWFDPRYFQQHL